MKLKRITTNLAIIMVLFTGCGNNQEASTATETTTQQVTNTEQTTVAETESTENNLISKDDNIYYDLDIDELEKLANGGDAKAQFSLGRLYAKGEKVTQDYQKAFEWYSKAVEQGNDYAQYNLGIMYINGYGVKQNYQKAFELFSKSAEQGNSNAQDILGTMYYYGDGIEQDYQKAFGWYSKAANQGNNYAQHNLGSMYYDGKGITQDYQKAFELFSKAANQEYDYAQYALGFMYYNGAGTTQNQQEGLEWINKAAEKGNIDAINFLKKLGVPTATQPTDLNANILKEGTYRVGKDIPAGEYIVIPNEGKSCYYEVSADSSGDSIITNENVDGQDYITLEEGQYFKIKRGTAQLAD